MLNEQPLETTLYCLDDAAPAPLQRRSSERHLSLLRVGSLVIGERRELCLIRNISAGGMMIRAYSRIAPGTRVLVELKEGDPLAARVEWAKDETVGLSFDSPIDVIGLISVSGTGPRPRMPRIQISRTAWIREDATVHRTKALDISQGGIKVASPAAMALGAEVIVTLTELAPLRAVVRWRDGDDYGITFNCPLGLPVLVAWLQDQQTSRRSSATG